MPPSPAASTTAFVLELDGARVGLAASYEGGEPVGDVVEVSLGGGNMLKKHVGNVRWTPIKVSLGVGMGDALFQWIKAFVARQGTRKNGAIIAFGANGKALSRLEWRNGQIVEVTFPGGDAADRSEGRITLTIQPEATIARDAAQEPRLTVGPKPKRWIRGNFRVTVDNIPTDTRRISRTEDFVVRQQVVEYRDGSARFPRIVLGAQKVGDVILTLPERQSSQFAAWAEDFLVQGHSSDSDERNGTFDYLDPSLRPLMTLSFRHLGIYRLARERAAAGDTVAKAKACLYCEEVVLDRPAATGAAPQRRLRKAAPGKKPAKRRR